MKQWNDKPYYSLDYYLKETYQEKVYRISLNAGMTCPNRDGSIGTGGCIFCSEGGSGDFAGHASRSIRSQLQAGKEKIQKKVSCHKFIAYFQAYTNTYASVPVLRALYMQAVADPDVVLLSIATRPDCLSDEILALLTEINALKPVWIEFGLQTIHKKTSDFIKSGFSLACFEESAARLQAAGIPLVVHIILGLPGETKADMLETIRYLAEQPVSGVKLQLLHILKHTALADYYEAHPFPLFTLESYCDFIVDCIELLPEHMVIHRLTGDGPKDLLIAPKWSTDKKRVLNTIHKRFRQRDTWQGKQ